MPVILKNAAHPIKSARTAAKGKILNIASLTIRDGEFVGIIDAGEGGASVLGEILCGCIQPEFGELSLCFSDGKRPAVPLFFDGACEKTFSESSVEKEVLQRMKGSKLRKEEILYEAGKAFDLVGLDYEAVKKLSPFELSPGDKRKAALAAGLVRHPNILVLNDPMRDMDELWCTALMQLLGKINAQGTTVLLISSDTSRLAEYADRIIILKNGSIVIDSSAKNVFSEYYALIHLGLPVPEVRKCCQMLRTQGMDMPNNIILYDQFLDRLKILMWRKNR